MKKIILTALVLAAFQETPIVANPLEDFAAGLFFGTCPIYGHIWLYQALIGFKKEAPQKAAVAVPSSLAGTYVWYKTAEYLRNNTELGITSYVVPALPVLLITAGLRFVGAVHSIRPNPKR